MQESWRTHLVEMGANISDDRVVDFGDAEAEMAAVDSDNIIMDLSHFGLISVSGEDATHFLQSQFSNDVMQVTTAHSQLSSYCTPKGRILASFRLFADHEHYFMQMPRTLIEQTLKRLRMYVLRSKVELNDVSDDCARIGLAGPDATELAATLGEVPTEIDGISQIDGITLLRMPGEPARYEAIGKIEAMIEIWRKLADKARPVGADGWTQLNIRAGIPVIQPETIDSFVPQMVNMHAIDGVSFKKGCYPGQEIVARMQYLGKLKRRMYRAHVDTVEKAGAGGELFSAGDNKQSIGKIIEAAPSAQGGYDLLAVIQIAELAKGDVLLHNKQGAILEFQDLPYTVEE